ncbi:hypothetical protein [Glycomyces terrestris]|uniref:NACHT domain-containing protein n=1 Tax=Glycomyces terrestris TaxID=2493553 RepID=A0A426UW14_9ACTN|nr:hypothetical protein [Glycomyces terrestris]RRR98536.1 hypothetical protein EIW28_16810 [Glycomyces terrestris]
MAIAQPHLSVEVWLSLSGLLIAVLTLFLTIPGTRQALYANRSVTGEFDLPALRRGVRRRWEAAAEQRGLQDDTLGIVWRNTDRPVTRVAGRTLDDLVDVPNDVTHLGAHWRALAAPRQLVVLGPRGAGKTSTLVLLAHDLLSEGEDAPLPVPVNLNGWDPRKTGLDAWAAAQLIEEFPDLKRRTRSGASAARTLLEDGTLIPFFDGLDESHDHAEGLRVFNATWRKRAFVVSCRAEEFEEAVRLRHESLAAAPVIDLQPVTPAQATSYLPSGGQIDGDRRWSDVIGRITSNPDGVLASALSTPLMVYLAQIAYQVEPTADELLEFDSATAIEQRLFRAYLPALYSGRHPRGDTEQRHTPAEADRWLGFLAAQASASQGVAWWRLPAACGPWFLVGYIALTVAIAWILVGSAAGFWYGAIFAAGIGLRIPAYSNPVISTHGHRAGDITIGVLCGTLCGTIGFLAGGLASALSIGVASSIAVKFAIEAYQRHGVDEYPRTPIEVLREDVKHSLQLALSAGVSVFAAAIFMDGPLGALVFGLVGAFAGGQAGYFDTGPLRGAIPGALTYGTIGAVSGGIRLDVVDGVLLALGTVSTVIALNVWYRSLWARLWLGVTGRLPYRVMRFLENAAQLGVLRRTGAVYRFRHERIQTYLASKYAPDHQAPPVLGTRGATP